MATVARGGINIVDLNDNLAINASIQSSLPTTQIYAQDSTTYKPDWSVAPNLVLTPYLALSGFPGVNSATTAGRIKAGSMQWRKDGVLIVNGTDYAIGAAAPFALTVKKNVITGGSNARFTFSCIVVDPNTQLETSVEGVETFTVMNATSSGLNAQIYAPQGTQFQNDQFSTLTLQCELTRGIDPLTANVGYVWAIRDAGAFAPTTAAAAATAGQKVVTFTSVVGVVAGSQVTIGSATYNVASVNTGTKAVTMVENISTAVASGAAITCPHYDAGLGVGWSKISANAYFNGITGFNTSTLTVPAKAVLNIEVFRCVATDNAAGSTTNGQKAQATVSLSDTSDPYRLGYSTPELTVIKNGTGQINVTAYVFQGNSLDDIDPAGNKFSYIWSKRDMSGVLDPSFNKTGKTVAITKAEVNGQAYFMLNLDNNV